MTTGERASQGAPATEERNDPGVEQSDRVTADVTATPHAADGPADAAVRAMPDLDTVDRAGQTPGTAQPFADLGLKEDEYASIKEILGRRPTTAEIGRAHV